MASMNASTSSGISSETHPRAIRLFWLIASLLLGSMLLGMSILISHRLPAIAVQSDTWFGSDVDRHVNWVLYGFPMRAHLHPLSFLVFLILGYLLRAAFVPVRWYPVVFSALPVLIGFAVIVPWAALSFANEVRVSLRERLIGSLLCLVALTVIGPCFTYAYLPESHVPGGICLLIEAVCVVCQLRRGERETEHKDSRLGRFALFAGAAATGCTLTNAFSAALLLLPVFRRRLVPWVLLTIGAMAVLELLLFTVYKTSYLTGVSKGVPNGVAFEASYVALPNAHAFQLAFNHVCVVQFGAPNTSLARIHDYTLYSDSPPDALGVFLSEKILLQAVACFVWFAGIVKYLYDRRLHHMTEKPLVVSCLVLLPLLFVFHAGYDVTESYIFSPDVWPLIVVPGILCAVDSWRRRHYDVLIVLLAATMFSAAQTLWAVPHLLHLLSHAAIIRTYPVTNR